MCAGNRRTSPQQPWEKRTDLLSGGTWVLAPLEGVRRGDVNLTAPANHALYGTVTLLNAANWENVMWRDHPDTVVQGPPLPGRDHQPLRVALLQVLAQFP